MTDLVHYTLREAIATLCLDSPANRNALSADLVGQLRACLDRASEDPQVRAVVLRHTGTSFCSGADLREQARPDGPAQGTRRMLALFEQVLAVPKPVLAAVDGHVRAGGLGLVGACDVVFAGPGASFAFTEVRLALAPAMISLTTFGRMSERAAARYCLSGERFDAAAAAASGLITGAVDDPGAAVEALCHELRACSPQGLAETKLLLTQPIREGIAERASTLQALSQRLFASEQAREGMRAFLDKRPVPWAVQ